LSFERLLRYHLGCTSGATIRLRDVFLTGVVRSLRGESAFSLLF
jgi:hypothetical protein